MSNPRQPGRLKPYIALVIIYFTGFILTRKGSTDTTIGIVMLIIGWLLLILSIVFGVIFIYHIFKDAFNKKK